MTAVVHYLVGEVLELAGSVAKELQS